MTVGEHCHWIRESLATFPQPPNRTSLTAVYGPIADLFDAAQDQKILIETQSLPADAEHETSNGENSLHTSEYIFSEATDSAHRGESCKPIAASILLRKLRWSTLGLQFDWSKVSKQFMLLFFIFIFGWSKSRSIEIIFLCCIFRVRIF